MEHQPPSLSDKIARLRTTAQAQEKCAWIPASIHDLIMACLTRIFAQLEQMVALWQAGCLPAPGARPSGQMAATRGSIQSSGPRLNVDRADQSPNLARHPARVSPQGREDREGEGSALNPQRVSDPLIPLLLVAVPAAISRTRVSLWGRWRSQKTLGAPNFQPTVIINLSYRIKVQGLGPWRVWAEPSFPHLRALWTPPLAHHQPPTGPSAANRPFFEEQQRA